MTICFYSPYIPNHFGGGEKHLFDVALSAAKSHTITLAIPTAKASTEQDLEKIKSSYETFLNRDLSKITFTATPLNTQASFFSKLQWTKKFDAIYYVTDGSTFFSLAPNNYLHIQVPYTFAKKGLVERLKLDNWHHKNTNSEFTKQVVQRAWNTTIDVVIQPVVDMQEFQKAYQKEKIILNVGRFFKQLHSKRQDVLVDVFKKLYAQNPEEMKKWQLIMVGSVEDEEYVREIEKNTAGFPIKIIKNASRKELVELYEKSSLYWHATGFDVNESINPEKVEHFGISTVEAMAAGVVPIVHLKGGQKEILGEELKMLGWFSVEECVKKTIDLITNNKQLNVYREMAHERAKLFSQPVFDKKIETLFNR